MAPPADGSSDPLSSSLHSGVLQTPPPQPSLIGLLAGDITEHDRHHRPQLPSALSASAPPPWPLPLLILLLLLLLLPQWAEPLAASHTSPLMSHSILRL